ncbi:UDP-N-acetylmuramoyl-tripeptide--D-alanyl-D-alanine ligase [Alkalibacillus filiformis]|uniref:UDP-N-acetylmuramoyl-tripeptide--D-alanyl-D-alanine ligase n=1 Tax=Alkalibacillus filiformis TaxID=200990 RepID=A0ABU0DQ02_9BACI|nr:UDP-N-acetylmuramoyl-tripeptide--D-alanyl-D-alanine ligase [Alkalibacillus filiformis]MDQ0350522.1 UDP-N-acetylmuramoyl-tripeptide--D-alanyl-D-alanine ligase [Alkalibacillus filiformis]
MKKFSADFLHKIFLEYQGSINQQLDIETIYTDSREVVTNGLFVPLIGERFNGHDFLLQAIDKGAVASLWSKREEVPADLPDNFPLFFVEDPLEGLQQLATAYRDYINPTVIGVTGSNGKTTTKELIGSSLSEFYQVTKTEGNLNNLIGLPLSILRMPVQTEVLVLEMGMSGFSEIEQLSYIAKPDIAVITNIGESHIEHLGSREGISKAKLEIVEGLSEDGVLVVDGDEPLLEVDLPQRVVTCGFNSGLDYEVKDVVQSQNKTTFKINDQLFSIPLLGMHQAKNTAYALAISDLLNIDASKMAYSLANLSLPGMRFEQIETESGAVIVNDAYNASATSMRASIDVIKRFSQTYKVLVLGDIFELGQFAESEHRKVGEIINQEIDVVFTVGQDSQYIIKALPNDFKGRAEHFEDRDMLMNELEKYIKNDTVVLFKASRGMKFEQLIQHFIS